MSDNNIEELISALYEAVQNARTMPLAPDKCIVERDKILDMLDDLGAQLPEELKQSRTIVASRSELINQARHEAENIIRQAQEKARILVTQEAIYTESKRQCEEMVRQTQVKIKELQKVSNAYMDEALQTTEDAMNKAISDVRQVRAKFQAVTEAQAKRNG